MEDAKRFDQEEGVLYACYGLVVTLLLHWGHSSPHFPIQIFSIFYAFEI
jgi:hypothetical protein